MLIAKSISHDERFCLHPGENVRTLLHAVQQYSQAVVEDRTYRSSDQISKPSFRLGGVMLSECKGVVCVVVAGDPQYPRVTTKVSVNR